jgi:3-isopropylmalate/(R)-2-methylmalate dehydratase large subunit
MPSLEFKKILYLTPSAEKLRAQLSGQRLTLQQATPLRDDISTDEITPVAILSHYDDKLGDYAHTGLQLNGEQPIAVRTLRASGVDVLVAGRRYGKGSSREHSPEGLFAIVGDVEDVEDGLSWGASKA